MNFKELTKEYARKYSYIADKDTINIDIFILKANEELTKLMHTLIEDKGKSIYSIGRTLMGLFPELIHFNFSKGAINGEYPMFYFYKNEIDMEYFLAKLHSLIKEIYVALQLIESEKIQLKERLMGINKLTIEYIGNDKLPDFIWNKALKYHITSLVVEKDLKIGIESLKQIYLGDNLAIKRGYEERLGSNDYRIIEFMIANNGSDIECVSTPIAFGKQFFSYVINFDIHPYINNKVEIFYRCSIRRWINEKKLNISFNGEKSIYLSREGSNKLIKVAFTSESSSKEKGQVEYRISSVSQKIIEELFGITDFQEDIKNAERNLSELKGFIGIPISQDIVDLLTKGRFLKVTGEGTLDSLFFYETIYQRFIEKNFLCKKSDKMPIFKSSVFKIGSLSAFDLEKACIDNDFKKLSVLYFYSDDKLKENALNAIKTIPSIRKDKEYVFNLEKINNDMAIFSTEINQRKMVLKLVFVKTTIFQDLLPKCDLSTIGLDIEDDKEKNLLINEVRKKNALKAVNKYRDLIEDTIDEYVEDDELVASIVDIPDYHNRKYQYRDPYKYIKNAFFKENQHVQIRNSVEYDEEDDVKIKSTFISSMKDIYSKLGVYVNFKDREASFNALSCEGINYIVGLNYIRIENLDILVAVKMDRSAVFIKVPNFKFYIDKIEFEGVSKWIPIMKGLKSIETILKDISLFKWKKEKLRNIVKSANDEFIKRVVVDRDALYILKNTTFNKFKDSLENLRVVILKDNIIVKHQTFKHVVASNEDKMTASCMVAKDLVKGNEYISTSARPETLQKAPTVSSRFIQQNKDTRRARAVLFDVINVEDSDLIACLIHELRKMSISYDTSNKMPYPIYLIEVLGDEAKKIDYSV